ncbi:MAG: triose-phosphate isomerase [Candidatus Paceibacterota bacterium]|jgi:triosephosphate isomerase
MIFNKKQPRSVKAVRGEKKLIVGNWKMNPQTVLEARKLFLAIKKEAGNFRRVDTVMCPPFVFLGDLAPRISGQKCVLGSQNVFFEEAGAFTGEISAPMLQSLRAKYAIVGHSERRAMGETDGVISKKISAGIKAGLTIILCIGEKERDAECAYLQILKEQIIASLSGVPKESLSKIVIAYEPVWAIGAKATGVATPEALLETIIFIRKILSDLYDQPSAHAMKILYGGSADETNAGSFMRDGGANGLLVGRASLDAKKFIEIVKIADSL